MSPLVHNRSCVAITFTKNRKSNLKGKQYVWQDAVTFRRHLGFGLTRRNKFLAARVGYYPCSTSYFHKCRLIVLSGDVKLNPEMLDRQRE